MARRLTGSACAAGRTGDLSEQQRIRRTSDVDAVGDGSSIPRQSAERRSDDLGTVVLRPRARTRRVVLVGTKRASGRHARPLRGRRAAAFGTNRSDGRSCKRLTDSVAYSVLE